jgi:predicted small metal-binding protein
MEKEIRCKDAGINCDFVARGQSDDEVMKIATEHGRQKHGMNQITPELQQKMRSIIHNAK